MSKSRKTSARDGSFGLNDRQAPDFRHQGQIQAADYTPFEPLITTAILTATAFRLRDDDALTEALRMLVQAVRPFEARLSEE